MKKTRICDLPDLFGAPFPRPILYCGQCGNEESAHRPDYFMLPEDRVLTCCGVPMRLVIKATVYEPYEKKAS